MISVNFIIKDSIENSTLNAVDNLGLGIVFNYCLRNRLGRLPSAISIYAFLFDL